MKEQKKQMTNLKRWLKTKAESFSGKSENKIRKNETNECLTVKNENGERVLDPNEILNTTADFYEKLYGKKEVRPHEHHDKVINELEDFRHDLSHEQEWYNKLPTIDEIKEVIENKKKQQGNHGSEKWTLEK